MRSQGANQGRAAAPRVADRAALQETNRAKGAGPSLLNDGRRGIPRTGEDD